MTGVRLTEDEIRACEEMAAEKGIAYLLDHLGLDGLGNYVNALRAEALALYEPIYEDVETYGATGLSMSDALEERIQQRLR